MNKTQLYEMISELLDETQWGGFTGGAAPLDEPPMDSGPMSPEQQRKVFDILVDTGSDPEELKASGDYPDVVEENIMNIKQMIKEELQKYLKEFDIPQTPTDAGRKMGQDPTGDETSTLGLEEADKGSAQKALLAALTDKVRDFFKVVPPDQGGEQSAAEVLAMLSKNLKQ